MFSGRRRFTSTTKNLSSTTKVSSSIPRSITHQITLQNSTTADDRSIKTNNINKHFNSILAVQILREINRQSSSSLWKNNYSHETIQDILEQFILQQQRNETPPPLLQDFRLIKSIAASLGLKNSLYENFVPTNNISKNKLMTKTAMYIHFTSKNRNGENNNSNNSNSNNNTLLFNTMTSSSSMKMRSIIEQQSQLSQALILYTAQQQQLAMAHVDTSNNITSHLRGVFKLSSRIYERYVCPLLDAAGSSSSCDADILGVTSNSKRLLSQSIVSRTPMSVWGGIIQGLGHELKSQVKRLAITSSSSSTTKSNSSDASPKVPQSVFKKSLDNAIQVIQFVWNLNGVLSSNTMTTMMMNKSNTSKSTIKNFLSRLSSSSMADDAVSVKTTLLKNVELILLSQEQQEHSSSQINNELLLLSSMNESSDKTNNILLSQRATQRSRIILDALTESVLEDLESSSSSWRKLSFDLVCGLFVAQSRQLVIARKSNVIRSSSLQQQSSLMCFLSFDLNDTSTQQQQQYDIAVEEEEEQYEERVEEICQNMFDLLVRGGGGTTSSSNNGNILLQLFSALTLSSITTSTSATSSTSSSAATSSSSSLALLDFLDGIVNLIDCSEDIVTRSMSTIEQTASLLCQIYPLFSSSSSSFDVDDHVNPDTTKLLQEIMTRILLIVEVFLSQGALRPALDLFTIWSDLVFVVDERIKKQQNNNMNNKNNSSSPQRLLLLSSQIPLPLIESLLLAARSCDEKGASSASSPSIVDTLTKLYRRKQYQQSHANTKSRTNNNKIDSNKRSKNKNINKDDDDDDLVKKETIVTNLKARNNNKVNPFFMSSSEDTYVLSTSSSSINNNKDDDRNNNKNAKRANNSKKGSYESSSSSSTTTFRHYYRHDKTNIKCNDNGNKIYYELSIQKPTLTMMEEQLGMMVAPGGQIIVRK